MGDISEPLLLQRDWCSTLGSPLYAFLLERTVESYRAGGICHLVLQAHADDDRRTLLPLRFLGAVHRLVLEGRAPGLAAHYPSMGGLPDYGTLWAAFEAALADNREALGRLIPQPVQTNEVGRVEVLGGGFRAIARETGLPLRLLEVGASAGLNLRWTHPEVRVTERAGCDLQPLDATLEETRLTLQSYVWADQMERLQRLRAALDRAPEVAVRLEQADAVDFVRRELQELRDCTVVFHSIVMMYLTPEGRTEFANELRRRGEAATKETPLAWLQMERGADQAELRLTLWPGGEERLLARSTFHGPPVQWV